MRRFVWLVVGLCLVLPVMAQVDATPTPNPTETFTPTLTLTLTPTFTPTVTSTPSPTSTHTATAETTASVVPSATPEIIQEVTAEVTDVVLPTVEATAEVTVEITEEATAEVTIQVTEIVTESVVEVTEEATVEVTEPVVEVTEEATAEVTAETTPEMLFTATPGGIALRYVQGVVTYQNRPTSAGISVMVWSQADVLLSVASTNESGIYSVPVPSDEPYWLVFNGELHQEVRVWMEVAQAVPNIVLFGGDLDGDGCIGQSDLNILIRNYDQPQTLESDINGDGITNLSDLAILTGNYQACDVETPLLPEENVTPEATAEITPEVAPTETGEPESTEAVMDVTLSPTGEASPPVETTEEAAQP